MGTIVEIHVTYREKPIVLSTWSTGEMVMENWKEAVSKKVDTFEVESSNGMKISIVLSKIDSVSVNPF